MNVRYRVELSQAERCELTAMLSKGKRAARKLKRAQILLAADAGRSDEETAEILEAHTDQIAKNDAPNGFGQKSPPARSGGLPPAGQIPGVAGTQAAPDKAQPLG